MNDIIDIAKVGVGCVGITIVALVATAVAPIVSLVALPFFACKAFPKWKEHRALYEADLPRVKYGRIPGQDYTRWDGKAIKQVNKKDIESDRMHALIGYYPHGAEGEKNKTSAFQHRPELEAPDCPFATDEDLQWLDRELVRREKEELLDRDLKPLRIFSKALIPIVGVIWVLFSETRNSGVCSVGCAACRQGNWADDTHWGWREAINFHRDSLHSKLWKED